MGWDFTYGASRKDIINELCADSKWTTREGKSCELRTIHRRAVGNVLWRVCHYTEDGNSHAFIACDLLRKSGDGWGYKGMDESIHPYYYSCPLSYLDIVKEGEKGTCPEWRAKVREYHTKRSVKLEVGATYELEGTTYPKTVKLISVRPLRGYGEDGRLYRIPRKHIGKILEVAEV